MKAINILGMAYCKSFFKCRPTLFGAILLINIEFSSLSRLFHNIDIFSRMHMSEKCIKDVIHLCEMDVL